MNKKQFETVAKWQQETFPKATALSKLKHLEKEIDEVRFDVEHGLKAFARHEFADGYCLLCGNRSTSARKSTKA